MSVASAIRSGTAKMASWSRPWNKPPNGSSRSSRFKTPRKAWRQRSRERTSALPADTPDGAVARSHRRLRSQISASNWGLMMDERGDIARRGKPGVSACAASTDMHEPAWSAAMSELRRDPTTDGWVIIAPERGRRPRESPRPFKRTAPTLRFDSTLPLLSLVTRRSCRRLSTKCHQRRSRAGGLE